MLADRALVCKPHRGKTRADRPIDSRRQARQQLPPGNSESRSASTHRNSNDEHVIDSRPASPSPQRCASEANQPRSYEHRGCVLSTQRPRICSGRHACVPAMRRTSGVCKKKDQEAAPGPFWRNQTTFMALVLRVEHKRAVDVVLPYLNCRWTSIVVGRQRWNNRKIR